MRIHIDETDEIAMSVVRADMARIYGEAVKRQASSPPVVDDDTTDELPVFLRRQAE
jgi:hypothetical protein